VCACACVGVCVGVCVCVFHFQGRNALIAAVESPLMKFVKGVEAICAFQESAKSFVGVWTKGLIKAGCKTELLAMSVSQKAQIGSDGEHLLRQVGALAELEDKSCKLNTLAIFDNKADLKDALLKFSQASTLTDAVIKELNLGEAAENAVKAFAKKMGETVAALTNDITVEKDAIRDVYEKYLCVFPAMETGEVSEVMWVVAQGTADSDSIGKEVSDFNASRLLSQH
jgi:hypothetical protein